MSVIEKKLAILQKRLEAANPLMRIWLRWKISRLVDGAQPKRGKVGETPEDELPTEAKEVLMCNGCVEYRPADEIEVCPQCLEITGEQYLVCKSCIDLGNHTCGE